MLDDLASREGASKLNGKVSKSMPQEVVFLNRCLEFLAPGGRMGIVLPDGVLANDSLQEVRDWILRWARLKAVVSLPQETFAPYGAGVKTSVVFLEKRERPLSVGEEDPGTWTRYEYTFDADGKIRVHTAVHADGAADYPVYMAQVENIGYDATGRLSVSEDESPFPQDVKATVASFVSGSSK